jgi:hypothetical protein
MYLIITMCISKFLRVVEAKWFTQKAVT